MIKYLTKKFDLNDDDILWENFTSFLRIIIPYEEATFNSLLETQKTAVVVFTYSSEVMGDGHMSFFELYGNYISSLMVMDALKKTSVSDAYVKILEKLPKDATTSPDAYDELDALFYQYGNDEIIDKIIFYVRQHHLDFFEYI